MTKKAAPSAKAALTQASVRWPLRSKASDGIVPSAAHTAANPRSDHEPGKAGYCHAFDLTHDPGHGVDCALISEDLRLARDVRVKYVIFNRRIYTAYAANGRSAWEWGGYGGSNPHNRHMHVSIRDVKPACLDTSPWPGIAVSFNKARPKPNVRVVRVNHLRLRTKPSLRAKVIERMDKGDHVNVLAGSALWLRVRHGHHTGYCWRAYTK